MTDAQLKMAAVVDITYFMVAFKACPTCGRKFDDMHPCENLAPHWQGDCKAAQQPESDKPSATSGE